MIGIVDDATGELKQIVESLDGVDLEGLVTIPDVPDGYLKRELVWDVGTRSFMDAGVSLAQQIAKARVDIKAGYRKAGIGSLGHFIDATYTAKESDAYRYAADRAEWLSGGGVDPDTHIEDYPYIKAGLWVDADTYFGVAQVYMNLAWIWHNYDAAVERVRIGTKNLIDAAEDREAVEMARASAVWPDAPA